MPSWTARHVLLRTTPRSRTRCTTVPGPLGSPAYTYATFPAFCYSSTYAAAHYPTFTTLWFSHNATPLHTYLPCRPYRGLRWTDDVFCRRPPSLRDWTYDWPTMGLRITSVYVAGLVALPAPPYLLQDFPLLPDLVPTHPDAHG